MIKVRLCGPWSLILKKFDFRGVEDSFVVPLLQEVDGEAMLTAGVDETSGTLLIANDNLVVRLREPDAG